MKLSEYANYDGLGIAELVKGGEISIREVCELALEAIEQVNPTINAVIGMAPTETERALCEAQSDAPFFGVPFLVKDVGTHFANVPSELGCRFARGLAPPGDTELAARFKKAGLVTLGRTNTPEFGCNVTTEPVKEGPTRNPWNLRHSTGGSSGGSAAAVAAGLVPLAHANDGGGSIRIPAANCGVFGLKPSRARMPAGPDADELIMGLGAELVVSRTVRDTAAILDATAGPDIGARVFLSPPESSFLSAVYRDPKKLRIAFSAKPLAGAPATHPECAKAVEEAAKLCEMLGHEVFEGAPQVPFEDVVLGFLEMGCCLIALGVDDLEAFNRRPVTRDDLEATTWKVMEYARSMTAMQLAKAWQRVNRLSRATGRFFTGCDIWLSPVATCPPVELGILNANDPALSAEQWITRIMEIGAFTPLFNQTGHPAFSIPLHWTPDGLPVGVHFVGHIGAEATLLSFAGQLERARPWKERRPPVCVQ